MAGNYPDVPGPRIAYDRDGSIGFSMPSGGPVTVMSTLELQTLNDEDTDTYGVPSTYVGVVFALKHDIVGVFMGDGSTGGGGGALTGLQTSVDTTNGLDGTWITQTTPTNNGGVPSAHRTGITGYALTGIKGIRMSYSTGGSGIRRAIYFWHMYGAVSAGESQDRLSFWHPTLDQEITGAYFDWGDVQRNTTSDKTFRIKNNSATLTANSITISQETLSDTTPTVNSQFTFSDGGAFAASINVGNLAPGAISPVITKRFARLSNASLALWTSRTIADPGSWT